MPLAYLDPGSGSYFIQIVIAFSLGGLFFLKQFWARIAVFFKGLFSWTKRDDQHKR